VTVDAGPAATAIGRGGAVVVDFKLDVVVIPVADVDRAKNFYKAPGWREDADFAREIVQEITTRLPGR
jgi:hypothetical protein